jgi:dimethylhistidine N-methyltransferase
MRQEKRMVSQTVSTAADRFTLRRLSNGRDTTSFAEDVRAGLTAPQKSLQPKYFYDALGSQLFEAICHLPEYYLTRAESEILCNSAAEIVAAAGGPARLVELGSGSAEKTRYLIKALLDRQGSLQYVPIDISTVSLERSSLELLQIYPRLSIKAYAADYFTALEALVEDTARGEKTIALFLGSNIGNFDPQGSRAFLKEVRRVLKSGDALLVGADLKKSADVLVRAYDDPLGVTSAFNLNLLVRMNRELQADFDVTRFRHRADYNQERGVVEIRMVSLAQQTAHLRALDLTVEFREGETIHTENSYKFDIPQLAEIARATGFSLDKTWFDSARRFSFNLFSAR